MPGRGRGGHRLARCPGRASRAATRSSTTSTTAAQLPWLEDRGIELFRGQRRLDGERRVVVGDDVLVAREAVILATGSTASMPPIPGLAEAGAWSNRQITTAHEVPRAAADPRRRRGRRRDGAGLGLVRVEGDDHRGRRLAARERGAVRRARRSGRSFSALGADLLFGAKAVAVRRDGERDHRRAGGRAHGGRRPAARRCRAQARTAPGSGLPSVGLADGGYVEVDDRPAGARRAVALRGRRCQRPLAADPRGQVPGADRGRPDPRRGRARGRSADLRAARPASSSPIRRSPSVGMTLAAAREAGIDAIAIDLPTGSSAGASFVGRGALGHLAVRRRPRAPGAGRRHLRRPRRQRLPAGGQHRCRRRGAADASSRTRSRRSRPAASSGSRSSRSTSARPASASTRVLRLSVMAADREGEN